MGPVAACFGTHQVSPEPAPQDHMPALGLVSIFTRAHLSPGSARFLFREDVKRKGPSGCPRLVLTNDKIHSVGSRYTWE